jgi:hypothetical protein
MGSEALAEGVAAAAVSHTGAIAVVTRVTGSVWVVEDADVDAPRPMRLPPPPLAPELAPGCRLAILPAVSTPSGHLEVMAAPACSSASAVGGWPLLLLAWFSYSLQTIAV